MRKIYLLILVVMVAFATEPKPEYQLTLLSQKVTSALINNTPRIIYDLFVPEFRREIPFPKFDSAVHYWYGNRKIARIQTRVIDTRGRGGHASTYLFFFGEKNYEYLYQSWILTDSGWQLLWISNILNQSFQFGNKDTSAMKEVALAALDCALSQKGLKKVHAHPLLLPDTIFVLQSLFPPESISTVKNRPVVWLPGDEDKKQRLPRSLPYYCKLGQIRILGSIALAAIDFYPVPPSGIKATSSPRGLQIYLKLEGKQWVFDSFGKVW